MPAIPPRRPPSLLLAALLAACATPPPSATPAPAGESYDVIVENGRIVDGTGAAWFHGDLAIRGDRIAALTPRGGLREARATRRVDATNLVVAPGFIDIQGQSTGQLTFGDGRLVSKVTQGVTTEILGEGSTPAPANERTQGDAGEASAEARARLLSFRGPGGRRDARPRTACA